MTKQFANSMPEGFDYKEVSLQVRKLAASSAPYLRLVIRLCEDLADDPGISVLRSRGYGYLVTLWYQAERRECGRGGFANIVEFARYVGPRPSDLHQLHRLSNDRPYEPGNLQWETAARGGVQRLVKGNTRPHRHMGKRLSHAELAAVIVSRGRLATESSVARQHQRYCKTMPREMATEEIFKSKGLKFDRSTCPIQNWDFPPPLERAAYAYQQYHRGRSRLEFAIEWLADEREDLFNKSRDPDYSNEQQEKYRLATVQAEASRTDLVLKLRELKEMKAAQDQVDYRLSHPHVGEDFWMTTEEQLDLFVPPPFVEVPKAQAPKKEELWPTFEQLVEWGAYDEKNQRRILSNCAIAKEAGLPYPYNHHPHHIWPKPAPRDVLFQVNKIREAKEAAGSVQLIAGELVSQVAAGGSLLLCAQPG